jgi:hypothetical protein
MLRLACLLLATVGLIVGCGTDSTSPSAKPEPVTLTYPARPGVTYVGIVGDSFTGGSSEGGYGGTGWAHHAYGQLRDQGIYIDEKVDAMYNSGWVKSSRKDARTFEEHLFKAVGTRDRLVVLFGGRDADAGVPTEQLAVAVQRTLAVAKERAPKASILVIGPAWTAWQDNGPSPEVLIVRDTVKAQATADGAVFVDPIAERWFADRPDFIGSDGVNPTNAGHVYMADKIAPVMAHLLAPSP